MLEGISLTPLITAPDGDHSGNYASLEAWKYTDDTYELTAKALRVEDVESWAHNSSYTTNKGSGSSTKIAGGLKILFAQPKSAFKEAVVPKLMSMKILEALHLPSCTFHSFHVHSGVYSCHRLPEGCTITNCERIAFVFRTPQKKETSLGGFALSHDFTTNITTALILGYAFSLEDLPRQRPPALESLVQTLNANQPSWTHPLLLPCLLMTMHAQLIRSYMVDDVSIQIVRLEHRVGVTRAGMPQKRLLDWRERNKVKADEPRLFRNGRIDRHHAKLLIEDINDLSQTIIFAIRAPQWHMECAEFLLDLLKHDPRLHGLANTSNQSLIETLEYTRNYCAGCLEIAQTSDARMKLQLNILYTSIAQDDSQTSARLATSAGRDSTSMKIIALITAFYLPGTFVATVFSMGIFQWQQDGDGASAVSPDFWIYWATTIPLTVITISLWAIWWQFEKHRFTRDVQQMQQREGLSWRMLFGESRPPGTKDHQA